MDISVIIVNYKQRGLVKQCVRGIKRLDLPFSYEIIVVDNDSWDGVKEMLEEKFPDDRHIVFIQAEKNRGFSAGNNLGIKAARGKYIFIVNSDTVILGDAIERMFFFMESEPEVGMVGPKLLNADRSVQQTVCRFPDLAIPFYRRTFLGRFSFGKKRLDRYLMRDWDHSSSRPVDWLFGAALFVRKEAVEKVGLMDERYFLYFEDVDWSRRFWENGYKVYYLHDAEIIHYHQRMSAGPLLKSLARPITRIHISSFIKYFLKFRGRSVPRAE